MFAEWQQSIKAVVVTPDFMGLTSIVKTEQESTRQNGEQSKVSESVELLQQIATKTHALQSMDLLSSSKMYPAS